MATTLEDLERRLAALEQEVARLREQRTNPRTDEIAADGWTRLLTEARASQAAISAMSEKVFKEMGITGEPVGVEKLREMMLAEGVNPEDNAFSRELIAMRDE